MTDRIYSDLLETAELTESSGWATAVTRTFYMKGVPGTTVGAIMLAALRDTSIPVSGDILSDDFSNMFVSTRKAQIITLDPSGTKADVKITVEYEAVPTAVGAGYTPEYGQPTMPYSVPLRGSGSLSQITTRKHYNGTPIELTYTHGGTTITRPVKVDVFDIHGTFTRETLEATNAPDDLKDYWLNAVNLTTFRGKEKDTWLCNQVEYELYSQWSNPMLYKFTWQFEYRPTKWIYEGVYEDDAGNIPSDVSDSTGNGIVKVYWHPAIDFNQKFGYP
jgi:hypothetical protein